MPPGPLSSRLIGPSRKWPFLITRPPVGDTAPQVYDKTGFAAAGVVGTGDRAAEYTKTGFATAGGVGSGTAVRVTPIPYTANFELGTHGATIATGDAGDATAWGLVIIPGTGALTYDDTQRAHGGKSAKFAQGGTQGAMQLRWTGLSTFAEHYGRFYIYLTAYWGSSNAIWLCGLSGATGVRFYLNSDGTLTLSNAAGSGVVATTNAVALNQWVRVEWHVIHSATVGQVELKLFNSPDSTTPTETKSTNALQNTGTGMNELYFGHGGTPGANFVSRLDSVGGGALNWPGPDTAATFWARTGFATAGGVGSGASQKVTGGNVYTKAGFASSGGVGAGADVDVAVEAGAGIAGLIGAGSSSSVFTRQGFSIVGTVGAGDAASVFVETGLSIAIAKASGSSASTFQEAGPGTVGTVGTGPSESLTQETGFGVVGTVGSGSATKAGSSDKTGNGVAGLVGSGPSASVNQETGFATAGGISAGVRARDRIRSGFAVVGSVGSGFASRASTVAKAGGAVLATVAAGARAFIAQETGFGKTGTVGAGVASKTTASQDKTGGASVGCTARGQSASVFDRTGSAAATLSARGAKAVVYTQNGYAILAGTGTGVRVTEHSRTGHGLLGLFAHGDNNEHFDAEPPGRFVITYTGQLAHTLRGHTDRSSATGVASAANGRISRSKTGALT